MNQETAINIVDKLLFGLQRVRSMSIEELTRLGWEEDTVKSVIADLIPWMQGEKGDAFLSALSLVSYRKSVTGQELYNFMVILHLLDRNLLMMVSAISDTIYPAPNPKWIIGLGM